MNWTVKLYPPKGRWHRWVGKGTDFYVVAHIPHIWSIGIIPSVECYSCSGAKPRDGSTTGYSRGRRQTPERQPLRNMRWSDESSGLSGGLAHIRHIQHRLNLDSPARQRGASRNSTFFSSRTTDRLFG